MVSFYVMAEIPEDTHLLREKEKGWTAPSHEHEWHSEWASHRKQQAWPICQLEWTRLGWQLETLQTLQIPILEDTCWNRKAIKFSKWIDIFVAVFHAFLFPVIECSGRDAPNIHSLFRYTIQKRGQYPAIFTSGTECWGNSGWAVIFITSLAAGPL